MLVLKSHHPTYLTHLCRTRPPTLVPNKTSLMAQVGNRHTWHTCAEQDVSYGTSEESTHLTHLCCVTLSCAPYDTLRCSVLNDTLRCTVLRSQVLRKSLSGAPCDSVRCAVWHSQVHHVTLSGAPCESVRSLCDTLRCTVWRSQVLRVSLSGAPCDVFRWAVWYSQTRRVTLSGAQCDTRRCAMWHSQVRHVTLSGAPQKNVQFSFLVFLFYICFNRNLLGHIWIHVTSVSIIITF